MSRSDYRTKVDLNIEDKTVDVAIISRESDEVVANESFAAIEVHENLRTDVALYGLSKLLQDRSSDTPVGPEKIAAMKEVLAQLKAGQWAKERKVGAAVVSAEVEALARLKSISVPAAQAALKQYPKEAREKILANPQIKDLASQIRAEREQAEATSLDDLV